MPFSIHVPIEAYGGFALIVVVAIGVLMYANGELW